MWHWLNRSRIPLLTGILLALALLTGAGDEAPIFNEPFQQAVPLEQLMEASDFAYEEITYYAKQPKPDFKRIETFASLIAEIGNINRYNARQQDYLQWAGNQINLGTQLAAAARNKDIDIVQAVHKQLLNNCNSCHDKYWKHEDH